MQRWIGAALRAWCAAVPAAAQDVDKLTWMAGNWVQKTATEEVQENWVGPRGNVLVAVNLTHTAGRGSSFEFLRIAQKDGTPVYFASPGRAAHA